MAIVETIIGAIVGAVSQKLPSRRSNRVAVTVIGDPPFGLLPNYFLPEIEHPKDLKGGERAGRTTNPFGKEYKEWVAKNRGVPSGTTYFQLAVQCLGSANVGLVGGRAVTHHIENVPGVAVRHQSGGPIDCFRLELDLGRGKLECYAEGAQSGCHEPIPLQFRIQPHATETFNVYARASDSAQIWHLELDFVVDGRRITKKVLQPSGSSFTTFPMDHAPTARTYYPSIAGWLEASELLQPPAQ